MNANKQDAGGEVTNPENVGGLPELPGCIIDFCRDLPPRRAEDLCTYIRAYGELCRAAPAGGDEDSLFTPAEHLAACREDWQRVCDALGANGQHMDPDDVLKAIGELSAPAGSGEVEELIDDLIQSATSRYDSGVSRLERRRAETEVATIRAALLRKLQQGADYVVVPREPTEAMMSAWFNGICNDGRTLKIDDDIRAAARQDWAVMIAASQDQDGGK